MSQNSRLKKDSIDIYIKANIESKSYIYIFSSSYIGVKESKYVNSYGYTVEQEREQ